MIVPMKKVTIVVLEKEREASLRRLAELGVLHVEHVRPPSGASVEDIKSRIYRISRVLEILPESERAEESRTPGDWDALMEKVVCLREEVVRREERRQRVRARIDLWKDWGDFDPSLIDNLRSRGVHVHLAVVSEKGLSSVPGDVVVERLFKKGSSVYCVLISRQPREFAFPLLPLPEKSLSELRSEEKEETRAIAAAAAELELLAVHRPALQSRLSQSLSELEFEQTRSGMGEAGRLSYLRGYSPRDQVRRLEESADRSGWAILVEEPGEKDQVPTLISNPRLVSLIRPVLEFIDIVPGYREVDPSLVFLFFFSLFFAMLIGDAAYGAIFLASAGLAHWRLGRRLADKRPIFLLYVLSIATVAWGVLTGTYFGQQWLPATVTGFVPWMRESNNVIRLCFLIGAIQLSIAHLWRVMMKAPSLLALADVGWICVIWTMYFVAGMFILARPLSPAVYGLGTAGLGLLVVFSIPPRNFFRDLVPRNFALFLSVISSFADVVSYIRLFAVGLASIAIADAFNTMAASLGWSSVLSGSIAALILLLGHVLNMILGGMAILVHGVRLNVLEFSSHLGNEWSGITYRPFRGMESRTGVDANPELKGAQ